MLTWIILACSTGSSGLDTAETADTSGDDTAPACATVTPGEDWAWSGECPQMETPVVVSVTDCSLALDYDSVGGMTMGMPYSAMIDGDTVMFADDNTVDGCSGTVESADAISGTCADGCTFKLRR